MVFAVIIVFAVAALATTFLLSGSTVEVPSVVGQPKAQAVSTMSQAGFTNCDTPTAADPAVPAGNVTKQSPDGKSQAKKGASCSLTISTGPAPVTVQDFTGQPVTALQTWATGKGVHVVQTADNASNATAGTITSQDPKTGTIPAGGTINVKVAGGLIPVPDVVGSALVDARSQLTQAGFKVSVSYKNTDDQSKDNTVASQTPDGNSNAAKNTTVTVSWSSGATSK